MLTLKKKKKKVHINEGKREFPFFGFTASIQYLSPWSPQGRSMNDLDTDVMYSGKPKQDRAVA